MPKPRTKRGSGREARKRKHDGEEEFVGGYEIDSKRPRVEADSNGGDKGNDHGDDHVNDNGDDNGYYPDEAATADGGFANHGEEPAEKEFFGMLADEEQEYFRRADEMLELNQFPTPEDRALFLESVYEEAKGKELKVASSQSCSRLMERLIQLANTSQKKRLFEAFAGHFLSLVQHRFASHCCEALFLRSAGVVSQELSGFVVDTEGTEAVATTYERDAQSFEPGSQTTFEVLQMEATEELAYWVGIQRAVTRLRGNAEPVKFNLRVTELFHREGDSWKMVHRHADPLHM